MRRLIALATLIGAFASLSAIASARPSVALKLSAVVVQKDADGKEKFVPVAGIVLKPGDRVRYDIVASNGGDAPASSVRPMDLVPAGTAFVANSATGGKVEYSLDRGKTWSPAPTVVVHEKDGDRTVKADPAAYTAIRWTSAAAIAPGASAHYAFEVAVK